ncbi:MAG TPA: S41 family peptidase [Jatrophihabitantaceae bacterium]|nr:S41 family peptidase [Jatrophihabitantaceae bacterium]
MTYLRFPSVSGDHIVFVADDDVWRVGIDGGRAERLTSDRVPASRPKLSADGSLVAWGSRRDGNPEVYVAPVAGGPASRLTYWNQNATRVLGWAADGRVVASSPALQPFRSRTWAYALPTDGSPAELLPYGPISGVARHPGGATVLMSTVNREAATWKRYRGGTRGRFWLDAEGGGEFDRFLTELDGQLGDPVWFGDRLVFLSDHQGHGNVYSVAADGSGLRRHSDHTGSYARDLGGDLEGGATRLVYQRAGRLYRVDDLAADSQPVPVEVELPGARVARQPSLAPVDRSLADAEVLSVDATGRASAVNIRGTVQWLTHRDGPVRTLAETPGVRTRLPRVRPEAKSAIWVTDAEGDDALELTEGTGTRRIAAGQLGRVLELTVAANGEHVAVASHDGRVLVVALGDGSVRELDSTDIGDSTGLVFSPDSAWLAWSKPHRSELRSIQLAELASGTVVDATPERFVDTSPAFTPDGKYLAYLSARTFDPVYDTHNFDLSFTVGVRPYLIPLRADTPSPFDPEETGRSVAPPDGKGNGKDETDGAVEVRVDLDGLSERTVVVPVAAGLHTDLRAAKGGLLWLTHPITGVIGAGLPEGTERPRPTLWRWDVAARRSAPLVEALDWYQLCGDGTRIVVRDGDKLRVGPADHAVKPSPDDSGPSELIDVDLGRVQVRYDPVAEGRQMIVETWRLMRDHFWVEDMGGVDWDDVLERYLPLADEIATRDDLSEVLWEMIGELGSSHAYERFEFPPPPKGRGAAFLGADLARDGDGRWVITRVLPSESSVPAARSPLRAAGANVQDGDVLLEVNGREVGAAGPGPLLAGLAGKPVELTIAREGKPRIVVAIPTADETPIRYQEWVSDRRATVHDAGDGRIGYVHVPDMTSTGWAEFNRDLRREIARDALVVDTRDNGGGHVSELVIERLARRPLGGNVARHAPEDTYPSGAPRGPMVSLANEHAGSDGDIVNEAFHELALGQIIGVRTWGGVIGIDGRYDLIDGTVVTQPRYSFWFRDVGWGVENYGVDPDIEVPHPPQAWASGDDPQLTEGLRVLTEELATATPLNPPPVSTRPDRSAPSLPPR